MKKHLIIHGFALAHALVVFLLAVLGWSDDICITVLTMLMVFALCYVYRRPVAEAGLLALFYILLGYYLGTWAAAMLDGLTPRISLVYSEMLVTFCLTELYGWVTYLIVRRQEFSNGQPSVRDWLLAVALFLSVLAYRVIFIAFDVDNSALLLPTLAFVFVLTILFKRRQTQEQLFQADSRRRKAQYQYQQLKQQLNPHFLFNCLNILDYIVQQGEQDRASAFIRKLAGIYRYQLSVGDMQMVPLEEELRHVRLYADLLRERFGEAFSLEVRVPDDWLELKVVPCSVQLMVENAQKHNVVSQSRPLRVEVYAEGTSICVCNNLQLRSSRPDSTGIGLQNIRLQYAALTRRQLEVVNDGKCFIVKLPIL